MVSQPPYLYNENTFMWKEGLSSELGPFWLYIYHMLLKLSFRGKAQKIHCIVDTAQDCGNFSSLAWSSCIAIHIYNSRADSRLAASQWETPLLCNDFSHWLGASLVSAQNSISLKQSQQTHDVIIMSLLYQNDVVTLFWHNNDVIIKLCVCWYVIPQL